MIKNYINVFTHRNKVYDIYYDENGKKHYNVVENYPFEYYIKSQEETGFKDYINNQNLIPCVYDSVSEHTQNLRRVKKELPEGSVFGGQSAADQYRMKEYGKTSIQTPLNVCFYDIETAFNTSKISEDGWTIIKDQGGFPKPQDANAPVVSISFYVKGKYYLLGLVDIDDSLLERNTTYIYCHTEKELLKTFFSIINKLDVDVLSAWNSSGFDSPYLSNRIKNLNMNVNMIDPLGLTQTVKMKDMNGEHICDYSAPKSVYWIDYLDVYKTFTFAPRESYSLENICNIELGEGKIKYEGEGDLEDLYNNDIIKFLNYNIQDVYLLVELDKATNLMPLSYDLSYLYNINCDKVFGTTAPWMQLFYKESFAKKLILPVGGSPEDVEIEGGYVYCDPGYYEWVTSFDVTSMYPLLGIVSFNLSPETYIPHNQLHIELQEIQDKYFSDLKASYDSISRMLSIPDDEVKEINRILDKHNVCCTPNGAFYTKDEVGLLPEIVHNVIKQRKIAKKEMIKCQQELATMSKDDPNYESLLFKITTLDNRQMSLKIAANSVYGAVSSKYFDLSNEDIGASITSLGRYFIRRCAQDVTETIGKHYGDKPVCIQSDTDSCYFQLEPLVKKFIESGKVDGNDEQAITDYIQTKIEPMLNKVIEVKSINNLVTLFNALNEDTIGMDREVIASSGLMVGKKNYALRVLDNESVRKTKLKVVGLNLKKTNIPAAIRVILMEFLEILFTGKESDLQTKYSQLEQDFRKMKISDISLPKKVNLSTDKAKEGAIPIGNDKYLWTLETKGCPIQVRSALVYNNYIDDNGLNNYDTIKSGDAIKYVKLKLPNILGSKVVGFPNKDGHLEFVEQQGFKKYIDYDTLFTDTVTKPLQPLVNLRNWSFEKSNDLFSMF